MKSRAQGRLDNTLVLYIWGDNGSSSEGLYGTISEQLAQNGIPTKISQHLAALEELGGLDALGGPKTDNMYHAGWAWAGSTPYQGTKLQGSLLWRYATTDGRVVAQEDQSRQDAATSVPSRRSTSYQRSMNCWTSLRRKSSTVFTQDTFDGVSMVYSLGDATAPGTRHTQFFDIMASRGVYQNGWFACALEDRENHGSAAFHRASASGRR